MATPHFNRLALAAALIEYDNDDDPFHYQVDHKKSAIFRDIYNPRPVLPQVPGEESGVPRPASFAPSHVSNRSRQSQLAPLQIDSPYPQDEEDIANIDRWGSEIVSPDGSVDPTRRQMPPTHSVAYSTTPVATSRPIAARIQSVHLEDGEEFVSQLAYATDEPEEGGAPRRRSMIGDEGGRLGTNMARLSVHDEYGEGPIMVPISDSPTSATFPRPGSQASGQRSMSRASGPQLDGGAGPSAEEEEVLRNPFELPAPPPELGSRFDPKSLDAQRRSIDLPRRASLEDGRPASLYSRRSSLVGGSQIEPADGRRRSTLLRPGSMVSEDQFSAQRESFYGDVEEVPPIQQYADIPSAEEYGRPLRAPKYYQHALKVARQELLRPKTLFMPQPLAGTDKNPHTIHVPDGFMIGEKPLPADARASILNQNMGVPLSLSQNTFRSSLMVGGTREDDLFFPGQAQEGERMGTRGYEDEDDDPRRPGKLYGTSLIDQLEARKQQWRGKQRYFKGDNRPSMMARDGSSGRLSTLIDPASLNDPPTLEPAGGLSPPRASLDGRPMTHGPGAALNYEDGAVPQDRSARSRTVFGVDTLWEREMAKLKTIQEADARAKAAKDEKEAAKAKRKSRWGKSKSMMVLDSEPAAAGGLDASNNTLSPEDPRLLAPGDPRLSLAPGDTRLSMGPGDPRLSMALADPRRSMTLDDPRISMAPGDPRLSMALGDPRLMDNRSPRIADTDELEEMHEPRIPNDRPPTLVFNPDRNSTIEIPDPNAPQPPRRPGSSLGVGDWFKSSDEENSDDDRPIRNARRKGTAPSRLTDQPPVLPPPPQLPSGAFAGGRDDDDDDDSSEEDVPLSKLKRGDSEEELPLSQLKNKGSSVQSGSVNNEPKASITLPTIKTEPPKLALDIPSGSPVTPAGQTGGLKPTGDEDDEEPLFIRMAKTRASAALSVTGMPARTGSAAPSNSQTVEEIEDDLPLGWKHADKAVKQHNQQQQQQQQQQQMQSAAQQAASMAYANSMRNSNMMYPMSPYGAPPSIYGSAYGVPSVYGVPGPYGMGMPNPMMGSMASLQPGMPFAPQPAEMPNPGKNIDDWRKQVPLEPNFTGAASVKSGRPASSVGWS